jgi:thiol-disulfide isomerase/thioredoxin
MKTSTIAILAITVVVIGVIGYAAAHKQTAPGKLDAFATCLGDKGAKFYGAFWCPHCQAQKALFGNSVKKLPYVECSLPDGQTRTPICIEKEITSYPTWILKDGTKLNGEIPLAELASSTGCTLPQ